MLFYSFTNSISFDLRHSTDCDCDDQGSLTNSCNATGVCTCKSDQIIGEKCNECGPNFHSFPSCKGNNIYFAGKAYFQCK